MSENQEPETCRMYPRMPLEVSCVIRRVTPDGAEAPHQMVKMKNVGLGGMLLETELAFAKGDAMRIVVLIGEQRLEARARVVFKRSVSNVLFQYGVEFTDILDENRDFLLACYLKSEYQIAD